MVRIEKNGVSFFRFKALSEFKEIEHGIFTRHKGLSKKPFDGLNVGVAVGDNPETVNKNRLAVAKAMAAKHLAFVRQIHGDKVLVLDGHDANNSKTILNTGIEADAIVTNCPGIFCAICVADCQPVLIYDPQKKVVGAIHSGWRGSLLNISGKAIRIMSEKFSCDPVNLVACVGPSLGPCCAEFINYKTEIPKQFWKYKSQDNHFDFWAMTRDQLGKAGILDKNIYFDNICTKCGPDDFYSFRKDKTTGRFAAVIGLKGNRL